MIKHPGLVFLFASFIVSFVLGIAIARLPLPAQRIISFIWVMMIAYGDTVFLVRWSMRTLK
jgi:hypothetical protein